MSGTQRAGMLCKLQQLGCCVCALEAACSGPAPGQAASLESSFATAAANTSPPSSSHQATQASVPCFCCHHASYSVHRWTSAQLLLPRTHPPRTHPNSPCPPPTHRARARPPPP